MFHILNRFFALSFTVASIGLDALMTKAEDRILTITAKSYITELFIDDRLIRNLVNEDRWFLTDDVDLSVGNRLVSVTATDTSHSCGGILASVTGDYLVTDASWKCSTENPPGWHTLGFNDSSWSDAYVIGINDGNITAPDECSVLAEIPSVSSNAAWVWTASIANAPVYDTTIFCRGYLPLCDIFPCRNGGTCHRNDQQVCTCPPYFFGTYCEQSNPTNVAALAREIVILNCQRASTNVTWWFTPAGGDGFQEIANNCSVLPQYLNQYAMDNANNACSLVVYTQQALAGTYACQDMSSTDDERAAAELIVLNGVQQCWSSPSSVVYGQNVTITCQLPYSGNWAPAIRWIDRYGQTVTNATTDTTSNNVTSQIVVPAFFPYVPSFTSIFYLSESSLPDVTDDIRANNTPTNIYVFATELVDVVCPAGFTKTLRYHCYRKIPEEYDWFEADTKCRQTYPGAYLAIISDASEQKDLDIYFNITFNETEGIRQYFTSGFATDGCYNFAWQPMPGYFLPMNYANWGDSSEPSCNSDNDENCIEILYGNPWYFGLWNDVPWHYPRQSLCEFELTPK